MTRHGRLASEVRTAGRTFLRRRTAMVFTFLFPAIIVLVFGVLVQVEAGSGLFARPDAYYVPGYLAVVVLFTPLSRVGSAVARHRDDRRFEKLSTTPLRAGEWLAAHLLVTTGVVLASAAVLLSLVLVATRADLALSPWIAALVVLATLAFGALGALLGRLADSQDGVIAASNALALPLLFLSETFVPPSMLPSWFRPALAASPLTHFSRGVRAAGAGEGAPLFEVGVLAALALALFALATWALPWRE